MIMVSPTGARLTKADHPGLPMTIDEIVATTQASAASGADALHLHIRDTDGRHSLDPGIYAEALAELNSALPDFPVQVTTESAGIYSPEDQCRLLQTLAPRWTSVSLREVAKDPALAQRIYDICKANGTEVQHIVYSPEDAETLRHWQTEGVLTLTENVILVLGRYGVQAARPSDLGPLLESLPPVGRWMVCAFGPAEHACLHCAFALGGDVRVGFENSIIQEDGTPWASVDASVRALSTALEQAA